MNNISGQVDLPESGFNPFKIIIPVIIALLLISLISQWYAANVLVPRYCNQPERALLSLEILLDESSPLLDQKRLQTMIAAKLLFLYPRQSEESKSAYLRRLQHQIQVQCG